MKTSPTALLFMDAAINLSGGLVLLTWLLNGALDLPIGGRVFLWSLAVLLVGISLAELLAHRRKGR